MRTLEPFEHHFWEFYDAQNKVVQEKIDYVLEIVISMEQIPKQFFTHLEDGIFEIRVKVGSNIYRIFCFFDAGRLVILLHAFQKKSQKIPRKEIERAKRLRTKYYETTKGGS